MSQLVKQEHPEEAATIERTRESADVHSRGSTSGRRMKN